MEAWWRPSLSWVSCQLTIESSFSMILSRVAEITRKPLSQQTHPPPKKNRKKKRKEEIKRLSHPVYQEYNRTCIVYLRILVVEVLENLAYLANASNLVVYLTKFMHYSPSNSANIVTNFMGTTFLLALLGGFLADAYITTYRIYLMSAAIEFMVSFCQNFSCYSFSTNGFHQFLQISSYSILLWLMSHDKPLDDNQSPSTIFTRV